jgi:adenine-specific DNA-methyltransferase
LDLRSHDIVTDKQAEIVRLFPEVRTESGKIDFDRLKRVLGEIVDPGKERYGMNWAGKADCFNAIQTASVCSPLRISYAIAERRAYSI